MTTNLQDSIRTQLEDLAQRWAALPYDKADSRFVLGDLRETTTVLCVGEALGEEEAKEGRPFVGDSGRRLRSTLEKTGFTPDEVSFANLFPRRPMDARGKNRTPTEDEIKANKPYLMELVKILAPKIVLLHGNTPLQAMTGRSKITEERGRDFTLEGYDDTLFLPTFHPANTLYRPSNRSLFEKDIRWAYRLHRGDYVDVSRKSFPFCETAGDLEGYLQRAAQAEFVYFDLETGAPLPARPVWHWDSRVRIILISLGWMEGDEPQAVVIRWNEQTAPLLKSFLESGKKFVGQMVLQFDAPVLEKHRIVVDRIVADTYLAARLLDENDSGGLKERLRDRIGLRGHTPYRTKTEEEKFHNSWINWEELSDEDRAQRIRYSALDSWGGIQDWTLLKQDFGPQKKLRRLYSNVLVPACASAIEMERTGLPINLDKLADLEDETSALIEVCEKSVKAILPEDAWQTVITSGRKKATKGSNEDINIGSTAQLGRILFGLYELPKVKITDKGNESTNEDALLLLLSLKGDSRFSPQAFDVLEWSLQYREARQLQNMFLVPMKNFIRDSEDGRIHGRFNVGGTDTLRLSSNDPNLQNWPKRLRKIVEAPPGWTFITADYNALEVRAAADQSQDPTLLRLLRRGEDLHFWNTKEFLRLPADAKRDDKPEYDALRYAVKTLFFASIYGAFDNKIAEVVRKKFRDAGLGPESVREILALRGVEPGNDPFKTLASQWRPWMFAKYKGLKRWHWRVRDRVTQTGEIESWFGSIRHLVDAKSDENRAMEDAVRQAINYVPQSSSLLTLVALRNLAEAREGLDDWYALAQVHDSITLLCKEEVAEQWAAILKDVMEDSSIWEEFETTFAVPLVVEVTNSKTWAPEKKVA